MCINFGCVVELNLRMIFGIAEGVVYCSAFLTESVGAALWLLRERHKTWRYCRDNHKTLRVFDLCALG